MGGDLPPITMTTKKRGLDDETKQELEEAAKIAEEKREREERRKRREATKYGGLIEDE